eukprot:4090212-Amphidinium_carterae.1
MRELTTRPSRCWPLWTPSKSTGLLLGSLLPPFATFLAWWALSWARDRKSCRLGRTSTLKKSLWRKWIGLSPLKGTRWSGSRRACAAPSVAKVRRTSLVGRGRRCR